MSEPEKLPAKLTKDELVRLLVIIAGDKCDYGVFWHTDLTFVAICNDWFWWATADGEEIENSSDIDLYEKSVNEAGDLGACLYCARKRKMRPQGAVYEHTPKNLWPLFDECGPPRLIGPGNHMLRPES